MGLLLIFMAVITVLQLILCKFSLWWLACFIVHILFSLRRIGAIIKAKSLIIAEGIINGIMILYNMMFHMKEFPLLRITLFILFSFICVVIMLYDDFTYAYITEDLED